LISLEIQSLATHMSPIKNKGPPHVISPTNS
jgi:hypothetical protein